MNASPLRLRTSQGYPFSKNLTQHYYTEESSWWDKSRKRFNRTHIVKEVKLPLFMDDVIICVEKLVK